MTSLTRVSKALWADRLVFRHFVEMTIDQTEDFRCRHGLTIEEVDEAYSIVLARWIADLDPADRA